MKKIQLLFFASLLSITAFGQNKRAGVIAPPEIAKQKLGYAPLFQQNLRGLNEVPNSLQSRDISNSAPVLSPNGKTQAVAPVELGRASNGYSSLRQQQNQVVAVDSLDLVMFIHRQDVTIFGGGTNDNGKYRYDLSTDNGGTFTNNVGPLQTVYTNYGRYPQMTAFNPTNSANPFDSKAVYNGPTNKFPTPGWVGYVFGAADVAAASPSTTDNYLFDGEETLLPGGLCMSTPGTFWSTDNTFDGTNILDSLWIFKGTWNSGTSDVDWVKHVGFDMPWSTSYDGAPHAIGPNMAFSPDGQDGWVGFVGDITGGVDSVYSPIFIHSSDGGATWGSPIEVQLDNISWIIDSLQTLWIDSLGNPSSTGRATTAFDADMTVDANGNPHLGVVIGSAGTSDSPEPGYSIAGTAKFMADVYSTDGGATWAVQYLAPVLTLRGEFGTPDANGALLTLDNGCQVARDESGEHVFFAWVDSDTNVVGFGEGNNLAPNLRICGKNIADNKQSCWMFVTDGDLVWDGKALVPTMGPIVTSCNNSATEWNLPIVLMEMITNDQQQPVRYWYFGNDCHISQSEITETSGGSFDGSCYYVTPSSCAVDVNHGTNPVNSIIAGAFPNPTNSNTTIYFTLPSSQRVNISLVNAMGQKIATLANGNYSEGRHDVSVNAGELSPGIYYYSIEGANELVSGKLVVVK